LLFHCIFPYVTKFTIASALFQFAESAKIYQKNSNMPQKSLAILVALKGCKVGGPEAPFKS
jgi:hypothetical protein